MKKIIEFLIICILFNFLYGCGIRNTFRIPEPMPDDRMHILEPHGQEVNLAKEALHKQFVMQVQKLFEPSRLVRKLAGKPKQAMNIDAFDEVQNSIWFTNRNARVQMTLDEIARGPDTEEGPDKSGSWIIFRAKLQGVTPGFQIKDSKGNRYVIKFDPTGYSELMTGAEVVSTKLFYAAGYNTPENYITYFHPDLLKVGDNVKFTDSKGRGRLMNQKDLRDILEHIHYLPDGRIRALASKYIEGKPIGPFKYVQTRIDDPNDTVPHQHRRELRGLRVIAAWLNHFDTKAQNSFDTYVTDGGKCYVKHYLMDFGSTLGSAARGPNKPFRGFEYDVDPHAFLIQFFSLGFYIPPYNKNKSVQYPSIGLYNSEFFKPHKYKSQIPNPAFEYMTARDGFWGAKIVMSFSDEQLKVAVEHGKYSNPEAAAYLLQVLKERRNIIGKYWFEHINPLDRFRIEDNSELRFTDLAVETGLEPADKSSYKYIISNNKKMKATQEGIIQSTNIPLPDKVDLIKENDNSHQENPYDIVWEVKIQTRRGEDKKWSKMVRAFISIDEASGKYVLIGIQRQD